MALDIMQFISTHKNYLSIVKSVSFWLETLNLNNYGLFKQLNFVIIKKYFKYKRNKRYINYSYPDSNGPPLRLSCSVDIFSDKHANLLGVIVVGCCLTAVFCGGFHVYAFRLPKVISSNEVG